MGSELCYQEISHGNRALMNPVLASRGPGSEVVALAADTAHALPELPTGDPNQHEPLGIGLWVSETRGATWEARSLPAIHEPTRGVPLGTVNPHLAFDGDGRLHLMGTYVHPGPANTLDRDLFHVQSADLGKTWGAVHWLTNGGKSTDPNIVAAGDFVYAAWNEREGDWLIGRTSWSRSSGGSWPAVPHRLEGCTVPGGGSGGRPLQAYNGTARLLCGSRSTGTIKTHLFHINGSASTVTPIDSRIPISADWLTAMPGGTLLGADQIRNLEGDVLVRATASGDGGAHWTEWTDLLELWPTRPDWNILQIGSMVGLGPNLFAFTITDVFPSNSPDLDPLRVTWTERQQRAEFAIASLDPPVLHLRSQLIDEPADASRILAPHVAEYTQGLTSGNNTVMVA